MESQNISCEVKDIEKMFSTFTKSNEIIMESLKEMKKEYSEISNVISTPNSNKIMPQICDFIFKYEKMTGENDVKFKNIFNTIIDEYSSFMSNTKKIIGDKS